MNVLAKVSNEKTMSSLEICNLTNKRHNNVLADILGLSVFYSSKYSAEKSAQLVTSSSYRDLSGKNNKCYLLSKDAALDLITGYSLPHRHAVNQRWLEIESAQPQFTVPANFAEALRLSADLQESLDEANHKIGQDAPKVEFAMAVRSMQGACAVSDFAKSIGFGRNTLFKMMRDDGLLMKNNMPYQNRVDQGIFKVIEQIPFTDSKGRTHPAFTTFVTGKGQVYLENKYRREAA